MNGELAPLWEPSWISSEPLKNALDVGKIVIVDVSEAQEVVQPEEVELFKENAWAY